jgi:hypothetical protein
LCQVKGLPRGLRQFRNSSTLGKGLEEQFGTAGNIGTVFPRRTADGHDSTVRFVRRKLGRR